MSAETATDSAERQELLRLRQIEKLYTAGLAALEPAYGIVLKELDQLRTQRDELLAACAEAVKTLDNGHALTHDARYRLCERLWAAIAIANAEPKP